MQGIEGRLAGLEKGQRDAAAQATREHAEVRSDFKDAIGDLGRELKDSIGGLEDKATQRLNKHAEEIDDLQEDRAARQALVQALVKVAVYVPSAIGAAAALAGLLSLFGLI